MPARKNKPSLSYRNTVSAEYRGKQTKTGNSSGFRFEGALFRSHPEFNGEVTARILAPGRMLVTAEPTEDEDADLVMATFVAFLANDIASVPQRIRPLDSKLAKRIDRLVEGVETHPAEELAGEVVL